MKARKKQPTDLLVRDGESVALVGHTVIRLSQLATTLLAELPYESWVHVEILSSRLLERLGPTPRGVDPIAMIITALRELEEQQLVTCRIAEPNAGPTGPVSS